MGVLRELVRAFRDGFNSGAGKAKEGQKADVEYETPAEEYRQKDMTVEREWLYPAGLPTFETLEGAAEASEEALTLEDAVSLALERIASGASKKDAVREVSRETGFPKNALYDAVLRMQDAD